MDLPDIEALLATVTPSEDLAVDMVVYVELAAQRVTLQDWLGTELCAPAPLTAALLGRLRGLGLVGYDVDNDRFMPLFAQL